MVLEISSWQTEDGNLFKSMGIIIPQEKVPPTNTCHASQRKVCLQTPPQLEFA